MAVCSPMLAGWQWTTMTDIRSLSALSGLPLDNCVLYGFNHLCSLTVSAYRVRGGRCECLLPLWNYRASHQLLIVFTKHWVWCELPEMPGKTCSALAFMEAMPLLGSRPSPTIPQKSIQCLLTTCQAECPMPYPCQKSLSGDNQKMG